MVAKTILACLLQTSLDKRGNATSLKWTLFSFSSSRGLEQRNWHPVTVNRCRWNQFPLISFASSFCWNEIFGFKTVHMRFTPGLRSAESLNPAVPAQICTPNPHERWFLSLLFFYTPPPPHTHTHTRSHSSHCLSSVALFLNINVIFHHQTLRSPPPPRLHLTTRSSSSSVSCTAHTVSRSKIWLYHHVLIPAPACSVAQYWFLPNWCRRPEIAPAVNFIAAVFLFVKKTFMHCSAVSVLPHPAMIICLRDVHTSESPLIFFFFTSPWNIYFHVICSGALFFFLLITSVIFAVFHIKSE